MKNLIYHWKKTIFLGLCLLLLNIGPSAALAQKITPCPTSTIPLPKSPVASNEFRFAAVGDTGRGDSKQKRLADTMRDIQSVTFFNLLLFLGDNVYNNGKPSNFEKKLYKPYAELKSRGVEIRGVVGNHDVMKYIEGVKMQQNYFGMGENTFYSFSKKNLISFFGLDSNLLVDYQPIKYTDKTKTLQNNWLVSELLNTSSKWNVVFMHHPVYSSSRKHGIFSNGNDIIQYNKAHELESLINPKVKLVLAGHSHAYEHIVPQNGVFYFVSGSGAETRKADADSKANFHKCGEIKKLSFMLFSVNPNTITFWAIGDDGKAFDSGMIQ